MAAEGGHGGHKWSKTAVTMAAHFRFFAYVKCHVTYKTVFTQDILVTQAALVWSLHSAHGCVCVKERERGRERESERERERERENLFAFHYKNKRLCVISSPHKKLCYIGCSDKVSPLFVYILKADKRL